MLRRPSSLTARNWILIKSSRRTLADRSFRLANVTDLYVAEKYRARIENHPWHYASSELKPRDSSKQLVIDLSHEQGYRRGHIPGAVNLPIQKFDFAKRVDFYGGISRGEIYTVMKSLGLSNETSEIILYDNSALFACRFWFVLRYFGFRNIRILNGGWRAWLKSGLPVDEEEVFPRPSSNLDLKPVRSYMLTKPSQMIFDVENRISKYVDSRTPEAYREYHIDGAINIPHTELVSNAMFRRVQDIRKIVANTGADAETDKFICYSANSISSAVDLFALSLAGADRVSLYDAGVHNWRQNFDSQLSRDAEEYLKH